VSFSLNYRYRRWFEKCAMVYLGLACFVALLIILFFLAPMPEITDADQQALEDKITESAVDPGPLRKQYNLFLGVWSQFCLCWSASRRGWIFH